MKKELCEIFDRLEEKVEKELRSITEQQNLSAADLDKMLKATCVLESMDMLKEESEGYSENSYGMSRGMHTRMMPDGHISYDRGRSPRTGRYVSRDDGPSYGERYSRTGSYGDHYGYSSHSINDRMIDALERMYDEATTDHERKEIDKQISRLRNGER
jgi:hypothetical protein